MPLPFIGYRRLPYFWHYYCQLNHPWFVRGIARTYYSEMGNRYKRLILGNKKSAPL